MRSSQAFATEWQEAWNNHDLPRILSHYTNDVVFRSRKAIALTGSGTLVGKPALKAYWAEALAMQPDLRFEVLEVFEGHEMLTLLYRNHNNVRAVEALCFTEDGLVSHASACHS